MTAPGTDRVHRKTLIGAVRSEATRLNRWTFIGVGAGLTVFFALMGTLIAFMIGTDIEGAAPAPGMGTAVDLNSPQGIVAGLPMAANLLGVLALSLWASAASVRLLLGMDPCDGPGRTPPLETPCRETLRPRWFHGGGDPVGDHRGSRASHRC